MVSMTGIIIAIRTGQANADKLSILYHLISIGCGIICIILERNDERKFNKLVRSGIVLKTTIDHKQSRAAISGFYDGLLIYSYYICEDGTRLGFAQMKHHYANMKILELPKFLFVLEKMLKKEEYVNVLVNPVDRNDYYIFGSEVGVPPEDKYKVHYANRRIYFLNSRWDRISL